MSTQQSGRSAEAIAQQFLEAHNHQLVTRNYRKKFGEIDLIMRESDTLVFCEVRYRRDPEHGSPIDTINPHKQSKIIRTACAYLQENDVFDTQCRFDIITLQGPSPKQAQIQWYPHAFDCGGHPSVF